MRATAARPSTPGASRRYSPRRAGGVPEASRWETTSTLETAAPPDAVWANIYADAEAWPRWNAELKEARLDGFKERKPLYSYSLFLGAFESGHLEGFIANSSPGYSEVGSPEALPAKAWSHVALTSDGAHLRLYVNGALVDTGNARAAGESEGPLYLGCWPSEEEHFEGRIDEVRVYNRALDGGEVAGDVGAPLQTPPSAPVATYAFDESEGTVAHDYAGGHDGTVEGASWAPRRASFIGRPLKTKARSMPRLPAE